MELAELIINTNSTYNDTHLQKVLIAECGHLFKSKVEKSLYLSKNCGNSYTASLYFGLMSILCDKTLDLTGKSVLMFSYGSGCAASMFTLNIKDGYKLIGEVSDFHHRLSNRIQKTPEEYSLTLKQREITYCDMKGYQSTSPVKELLPGTFYLENIDEKYRRYYKRVPIEAKDFNSKKPLGDATPTKNLNQTGVSSLIAIKKSKIFAISKL